jgi:hypothetical protein
LISAWVSHSNRKQCGRIVAAILLLIASSAFGDTTYLSPEDFLRQTFSEVPQPSLLWLDNNAQTQVTTALGHRYPQARLRYWRVANRTAWILDEIGKEYPITAGFVVTDAKIERAQVLIYRESRGSEIHLPAFLRQFIGAQLDDNVADGNKLSKDIEGITGATMSVDAMRRMARAALLLNRLAP